MLDYRPKLVAIDEEADHQIVHGRCFGKTNRPAYKAFDPRPQVDVFALNFLRMLFADFVLLGVDMTLIGAPAIGVKPCDAKRLQEGLQLQKDCILASPKNIRQHGATVVIVGRVRARYLFANSTDFTVVSLRVR